MSAPNMPTGVWRRAKWDWAYRIEVPGYGSVYGCGFASRAEALKAMRETRTDAEKRTADAEGGR